MYGVYPFFATNVADFTKKVKQGKYPIPKSMKVSLNFLDFIDKMLKVDPKQRAKASELKDHPFLTSKEIVFLES